MERIILIDLPTLPKGFVTLSLPTVDAALSRYFHVEMFDLNLLKFDDIDFSKYQDAVAWGFKVSSQNVKLAISYSNQLKKIFPETKIMWGGEFTSLRPEEAEKYCDILILGRIESIAEAVANDLALNVSKKRYVSNPENHLFISPKISQQLDKNYKQFMGVPLETSLGCVKNCTFCMVHITQPTINFKTESDLNRELLAYKNKMVYVIDFNLGIKRDHLLMVANAIKNSEALGWSCEMCLENLDDEEVLIALSESRCKIVYCGLESIDSDLLKKINKSKTNNTDNYHRIIKKIQSYGIGLAAGVIWGLPGSDRQTVLKTCQFFQEIGLHYVKFTFLTYNPGTKVKSSMEKLGTYTSDDDSIYDGNHLSYLPANSSHEEILSSARLSYKYFYSFGNMLSRSFKAKGILKKIERLMFNFLYRSSMNYWNTEVLNLKGPSYDKMLLEPHRSTLIERLANFVLLTVWKLQKYLNNINL